MARDDAPRPADDVDPTPTEDDRAVIAAEQAVLGEVQRELARAMAEPVAAVDFDRELMALRDQIAESRAEDHAALVEHMTRLSALRAAQDRDHAAPADPANPYFARLRLFDRKDGEAREREVLVGRRAFIDTRRGIQIVDWRNSPISRIYYCYQEGDEYEERFAGELQRGRVVARRTLNIEGGELVRIQQGERVLVRRREGWQRLAADRSRLAGGVGAAIRAPEERLGRGASDGRLPEITALIDAEQFRIITDKRAGVVIIRGGAGTGKTTIALHRVAFLFFEDPRRYAPKRMLVITPGDALRRYVSRVLPALDVPGVPIKTFPAWAHETVKRLVPALKGRALTDETPSGARRLKRAVPLLAMMEAHVRETARAFDAAFEAAGGAALLEAWVKRRNLAPMQRLDAVERWLGGEGKAVREARRPQVGRVLGRVRAELGDPVELWAELFSDRARVAEALGRARFAYHDWELDQLVDVVARQADEPDDLADIDEDRRTGVDGVGIDAGELRGRLDVDDLAAILRACQLLYGRLTGPSGQVVSYEHVVADEAQDLSPMSVAVLVGAVRPGGPVTLAGDTAQRLSLDAGFDDWDALVAELELKAHILPPLSVSYRSTRQVMALARHVLGPLAPAVQARDARDGAPVEMMRFAETGEAVAFLGDALKSLRSRERRATVALVARTAAVADLYYTALARAEVPELRRIREQEFDFTPGVDVTDVYQVKGLEYDYVVLLEPTAGHYPDTVEARHLLHVAATRAAHQLWLVASDRPSPLLPAALMEGRGIEGVDPTRAEAGDAG